MVMSPEMKVVENKLRRIAERRGYRLTKSRRRDPKAIGFGGYALIAEDSGLAVLGARFNATLDDVQEFLK
jgi:hypothetical protein